MDLGALSPIFCIRKLPLLVILCEKKINARIQKERPLFGQSLKIDVLAPFGLISPKKIPNQHPRSILEKNFWFLEFCFLTYRDS